MNEISKESLQVLRLRQNRRAQARDELETAMRSYWIKLSAIQPGNGPRWAADISSNCSAHTPERFSKPGLENLSI